MNRALLAMTVATAGLNFSCSSSSTAPEKGTPAYSWAAAKETFAANDYVKTTEHLDKLLATENEYTARARPWSLILTSGIVRGYMDVADKLESGVREKKADPGGFRKYISNSRSTAGRHSLHFAETFMRFQKGKDDPVALAFSYPSGSAAPIQELTKASAGMPLQGAEIEGAQKRAVERAVLMETCRAAGAPDDTAKATDLFKSGSAVECTSSHNTQVFTDSETLGSKKASIAARASARAAPVSPVDTSLGAIRRSASAASASVRVLSALTTSSISRRASRRRSSIRSSSFRLKVSSRLRRSCSRCCSRAPSSATVWRSRAARRRS